MLYLINATIKKAPNKNMVPGSKRLCRIQWSHLIAW